MLQCTNIKTLNAPYEYTCHMESTALVLWDAIGSQNNLKRHFE